MMVLSYLSMFIFLSGIFVFCINQQHFLLMLLSIEFVVLSLYLNICLLVMLYGFEYFFMLTYLTMSVCEGAAGLAILVGMIRSHGSDHVMTFSFLW